MSEQQWRVLDGNGNDQGPYSFQDLQGYYTTGNISHDTLVWTEGLAEWTPAGLIQGLLPDAPLPIVPLAEASARPVQQAAYSGGINLSPQVTVSKGSPLSGGIKEGAPTWLSITTIAIGFICLILFFFPWVSAEQDVSPSVQENIIKIFSQTGMQSVTGEKVILNSYAGSLPEFASSTLNLVAMIAIGISIVLALIGLLNKIAAATTASQLILTIAGLLVGIQMAQQFPIIKSYTTSMKAAIAEAEKQAKEVNQRPKNFERPVAEKPKKAGETGNDGLAPAPAADAADAAAAGEKNTPPTAEEETIIAATKLGLYYKSSFEASCFITVGLLASTIFLLVITMSSSNSTPLIIPQGGFQSPQAGTTPEQPRQPGSGLKFH